MSYLVGNTKDRFSRDEAHIRAVVAYFQSAVGVVSYSCP